MPTLGDFPTLARSICCNRYVKDYPYGPETITIADKRVDNLFWLALLDGVDTYSERIARAVFALHVIQLNNAEFCAQHLLDNGLPNQTQVTAALESAAHYALLNLLRTSLLGTVAIDELSDDDICRFDGICIIVRELLPEKKASFLVHMDNVISGRSIICHAMTIIKPCDEATVLLLPVHLQVMAAILFRWTGFKNPSIQAMCTAATEAVNFKKRERLAFDVKADSDEEDDDYAPESDQEEKDNDETLKDEGTPEEKEDDEEERKRKRTDDDDDDDVFPPKRLPASKKPAKRR